MQPGEVLKRRRRELGLSQQEIAERMGVAQPHVSHLERGTRNISRPSIDKVAKAYELSVDEVRRMTEMQSVTLYYSKDSEEGLALFFLRAVWPVLEAEDLESLREWSLERMANYWGSGRVSLAEAG